MLFGGTNIFCGRVFFWFWVGWSGVMARTFSIRRSLLSSMVLVVLIMSVVILGVTFLAGRYAVRSLSYQAVNQAINQVQVRLDSFVEPLVNHLYILGQWCENGVVGAGMADDKAALLYPFMEKHDYVSAIIVADSSGREYYLRRDETGRLVMRRRGAEGDYVESVWDEGRGKFVAADSVNVSGYDPRLRPWFEGAVKREGDLGHDRGGDFKDYVYWTEPYEFYESHEPGITISFCAEDKGGGQCVVALDILLSEIDRFTRQIRVLNQGDVVVMTAEEKPRILGYSVHGDFGRLIESRSPLLKSPADLGLAIIEDGVEAFGRNYEGYDSGNFDAELEIEPLSFRSGGQVWWGAMRSLGLGERKGLWVFVVIPERDLLGSIVRDRYLAVTVVIMVLILAVWLASYTAQKYSRPIENLVRTTDRISRGDFGVSAPIQSNVREICELSLAHERMRKGLESLMKLEGDLQLARQIQQRTMPDKLPCLPGFDIAAWNQPAEQTGGDTYDVIGGVALAADGGVELCNECVERVYLLLADATGHGIGPALSVTQLRSMFRMSLRMTNDLAHIALHMNEQLSVDLMDGRFVTAWLAELSAADSTLRYFSAGQAPLIYYNAAADEITAGGADTFPFGIVPEMKAIKVNELAMQTNDIYAVVSDGIYDAMNEREDLLGVERLLEIVKGNKKGSAAEILGAIRDAVDSFAGDVAANDDRTIIVIKKV